MNAKKCPVKKIVLSLSLLLILLWAVLGVGTSLAWFSDTSDKIENIFHFDSFDVLVEYRDKNGDYRDLDGATNVFDDQALYEPGYVQVVYLRVTNNGAIPFTFSTAVNVTDYTEATSLLGPKFLLQDYLRFGLVTADSEAALDQKLATRDQAAAFATETLNNYSEDHSVLMASATRYIAIIVTMPKDVDNIANYRLEPTPRVDLGLIITATQTNTTGT